MGTSIHIFVQFDPWIQNQWFHDSMVFTYKTVAQANYMQTTFGHYCILGNLATFLRNSIRV